MSTSINIAFTTTNSFVPAAPAQKIYSLYGANQAYLRYMYLSQDCLTLVFNSSSVVIPQTQLWLAAASALPVLTYPPVIGTQPTSSITVTHPTSASFVVSASAETAITYQWYYTSASIGPIVLSGANTGSIYGSYTGSQSPALTCSNTSVSVNKSASYLCVVSNTSGATSSSVGNLYVL